MARKDNPDVYLLIVNELYPLLAGVPSHIEQSRRVIIPNTNAMSADRTSEFLSVLFPTPFIKRLIQPLFAESARADRAIALLGAPLAYACAQMCDNPSIDLGALHTRAAYESIHSAQIRSRAVALSEKLAVEGIDAVAFKGLATALSVYPYAAYRTLPDVDLLFRETDLPRLAHCLAAWGWQHLKPSSQYGSIESLRRTKSPVRPELYPLTPVRLFEHPRATEHFRD